MHKNIIRTTHQSRTCVCVCVCVRCACVSFLCSSNSAWRCIHFFWTIRSVPCVCLSVCLCVIKASWWSLLFACYHRTATRTAKITASWNTPRAQYALVQCTHICFTSTTKTLNPILHYNVIYHCIPIYGNIFYFLTFFLFFFFFWFFEFGWRQTVHIANCYNGTHFGW